MAYIDCIPHGIQPRADGGRVALVGKGVENVDVDHQ